MTTVTRAAERSQLTAPNLTVDAANGVSYAYRRFGRSDDRRPALLFRQHFRGNLDNWDPLLVDAVAAHREVILLDNTGVGLSSGTVAHGHQDGARRDRVPRRASARVHRPARLLAGRHGRRGARVAAAPRRAPDRPGRHRPARRPADDGWIVDVERTANNPDNGIEDLLHIFFEATETSRTLGRQYIQPALRRTEDRDKPNGPQVTRAQYDAIVEWGAR